ncbi:hypothetical protein D3C86_1964850 [compost metagenome]
MQPQQCTIHCFEFYFVVAAVIPATTDQIDILDRSDLVTHDVVTEITFVRRHSFRIARTFLWSFVDEGVTVNTPSANTLFG